MMVDRYEASATLGINETSILHGNVTGDGKLFGYSYSWIEAHRSSSLLIALSCCTVATALSVYNIYQHLNHYTRPQLQRYIVRILVIVPVYAIGSFLSLKFVKQALYFDTIRDCYEAFVVYSFLALVLSFAGGESVCVLKMQSEPDITHAWPLSRCMSPIGRDGRLLRACKRATIQFVLIKPFFAMLSLVMLSIGQYNTLSYQLILTIVYNCSYSLALYGLWLFYLATKHILKSFNPVLKFFAVKSVIFLTFWQSSMIDLVPGITNEQSFAWKDFVLCVEMVPFAMLHLLAFNSTQFKKNLDRLPDSEVLKNMKEVLSLSDLFADAYHNFMPSYQEYMLQRVDSTGRRSKRSSSVLDDDVPSASACSSSTPTPMAQSNGMVPRFVIDDEDDDEDDDDIELGVTKSNSLESPEQPVNEAEDPPAIDEQAASTQANSSSKEKEPEAKSSTANDPSSSAAADSRRRNSPLHELPVTKSTVRCPGECSSEAEDEENGLLHR
ncbi:TPA: hypothetical protein N0F65_003689 [Lagenidium giganteum]|uniref:Uncharacterized protein n=1 Tax=Lagenidium giganteum TaxID=4803 RepID=A0AAV2YQW9_9STRA|nr:TPA: hypothetical protein N0F65_003689 [Lagenidium giganteum]